ncbi:MAG: PBP1A family penicillin-binding protein [Peptostreptococcaceae bacterium]|nr:PBP1A family penicillin-binding protein [Peptostreptococcaceae bacterium]
MDYNKPKPKKKKKGFKNALKVILIVVIIVGFLAAGATAGLVASSLKNIKKIDTSNINQILDENSFILDQNGLVIEKIQSDGLRTIVDYDDIDEDLKNAFLATEDRTFFQHHGFNYKRLVGAVLQGVTSGGRIKGTSTITQQLARNLYLSEIKSDRTYSRKIQEAYYTVQLEKDLKKEQIFEAYLNTIYLGSGAYGVNAASQTYFSKNADDLTIPESALIAGITSSPTNHSPIKVLKKEDVNEDDYIIDSNDEIYTTVFNPDSIDRYHSVLGFMKLEGYITEAEYQDGMTVDLKTILNPSKNKNSEISSYFSDLLKEDVIAALEETLNITRERAQEILYTQGLKIYSTLDLEMQKTLEDVYADSENFPKLQYSKDRQGNILVHQTIVLYQYDNIIDKSGDLIIPESDYKYDENGNLVLLKNKRINFISLYENGSVVGIQVIVSDTYKADTSKEQYLPSKDEYLIPEIFIYKGQKVLLPSESKSYDEDKNLVVAKSFLDSNPSFFNKDDSNNLAIDKENFSISSKGVVQPQSASVIIDYSTGSIKALMGGRNISGQKIFNRAINPRQPGSSIKPLSVYAPAIEMGMTPATIIDDVPHYGADGSLWPKNWYADKYWGLSTIREAIVWSQNVVAVKTEEQVGLSNSVDYLKKMGISTIRESGNYNDMNLSALALGGMTEGISPLEMAAAYGSLGNDGVYIKPRTFTKITDNSGNIIYENNPWKEFVVNEKTAFLITDMLREAVTAGTGARAKFESSNSKIPVAGKTGTTSDNYDAWFVGYTPYYSASVWIGNDLQIELDSGSKSSAILWQSFMNTIHENYADISFEKPNGIVTVAVDTKSGKLPTELSYLDPRNTVRNEYFAEGTQPTEYDDLHVQLTVCADSGLIPTGYCPITSLENRVFVKRNPPNEFATVPRDWIYEIPQKYCNIHGYGYLYQYNKDNLPEGTIQLPDGTIQLPGNILLMDDGSFMLPNGQIIPPQQNVNDYIESNPDLVNSPDPMTGELPPPTSFTPPEPPVEIQPEVESDTLNIDEDETKKNKKSE